MVSNSVTFLGLLGGLDCIQQDVLGNAFSTSPSTLGDFRVWEPLPPPDLGLDSPFLHGRAWLQFGFQGLPKVLSSFEQIRPHASTQQFLCSRGWHDAFCKATGVSLLPGPDWHRWLLKAVVSLSFFRMEEQRFYLEFNCLPWEAYFSLRLLFIIRANVHLRTVTDILVAMVPCREIVVVQTS